MSHWVAVMDFALSPRAADLRERVAAFMADHVEPIEEAYHRDLAQARLDGTQWTPLPVIEELKARAREQGLWNLFLPVERAGEYAGRYGTDGDEGLSNVDYAPLAELMGRSAIAPLVFNCNAPDTGNMEVLLRYGTRAQRDEWLDPLLDGRIRSAFTMTEPGVASSDATNMEATAVVDGDEVVVNGRKWWSTGVGHPDCRIFVFMGLTDPDADRHHRHRWSWSRATPRRPDRADAHDDGVRRRAARPRRGLVHRRPGAGRQHPLRPRRGVLDRAGATRPGPDPPLHAADRGRRGRARGGHPRGTSRTAFGKPLVDLGGNRERIADARIAIDQARLLVLHAAWKLDTGGPMNALSEVSQIKVVVPAMALGVIDMAMQIHGGAGLSDDFPLAMSWVNSRALRLADGPDEVHRGLVARLELGKYR